MTHCRFGTLRVRLVRIRRVDISAHLVGKLRTMPPDPVLLHALRTAPGEKVRRALHAAMDKLAEGQDWTEIERLVREHLSLPDTLRILEEPSAGTIAPAATSRRPPKSRGRR